jgi:carboxyl-terminal processing protease
MRLIPLFVVLPFIASVAFSAEKKKPEQYWTESGLSSKMMVQDLAGFSDQSCYSNLAQFRGCVAALNSFGSYGEPVIRVIPTALLSDENYKGARELNSYTGLSVVQLAPESDEEEEGATLRALFLKQDALRKKTDAALAEVFKMSSFRKTSFGGIFTAVYAHAMKDASKDAIATGAAISAYLAEVMDAHARLEVMAEVQDSVNDADESFFGIGATLQTVQKKSVVTGTSDGSPSSKVLKVNDIIKSVNSKNVPGGDVLVEGMALGKVVELIRGPEGTALSMQIVRKGVEMTVTLVRARIVQKNLESRIVSDFGRKVGHLKLRTFMDRSACNEIRSEIQSLTNKGAAGLVLDLRGNGGGLLDQAICMGGLFVGKKVIVKVQDLQKDNFQDMSSQSPQVTSLPMVTLLDAGSASASEVLSGALQDHKRSWILGVRSFGKATVQAPTGFLNENFLLYRTIQRFFQPSGRTNQMVGISPDVEVPVKPDATEEERFSLREAEVFPSGLEAVGPKWVQSRPQDVAQINDCVSRRNLAKNMYYAKKNTDEAVDYQLLAAQEVLGCVAR